MIFKSSERRNNTAERLLQHNPPIFTQTYLSTFEEVISNPFGAIWIRPIDYREVTKGTPFDAAEGRRQEWGYKRNTAREEFIEQQAKKLRILADE